MEFTNGKMETFTKEILQMAEQMDMEPCYILMEQNMKDNGKMIIEMERELLHIQTEEF